jgi:four helix bundle protein
MGCGGMRFEDLEVWKRSVQLCSEIYRELRELKDWGFRDQITRSALSIPSNIAEGVERLSAPDCIRFLGYAKGSCGELRTQIYIGLEIDYINQETGNKWHKETIELSSMLAGFMKSKNQKK